MLDTSLHTTRSKQLSNAARQMLTGDTSEGAMGAATHGPLDKAIQRLIEVLDEETAALKSNRAVDLKGFNDRKSQGFLELNRVLRHSEGSSPVDKGMLDRLAALRSKLQVNQAVLKMHLDAVREISSVVADALRDAESDGTYSPSICGAETRP